MANSKLDLRQSETRILQDQLNSAIVTEMDVTLASINNELTPPGRLIAASTPSLAVTVGTGDIVNPNTSKNRVLSPIGNVVVPFTGGTLTFPSTSGIIINSNGSSPTITIGVSQFVAVLVQVSNTGAISALVGTAAGSPSAAVIPNAVGGFLPLGYILVQSNGSSVIQNITNAMLFQFSSPTSPSVGTISSLPSTPTGAAGVAWANAESAFQFLMDSGIVGANIDIGTLILRYPGSYPSTPSGTNWIEMRVPSSIAAGYALTLPTGLPTSSNSLLLTDTGGIQTYLPLGAANEVLMVNTAGTALQYSHIGTNNLADFSVDATVLSHPNYATGLTSGTVSTGSIALVSGSVLSITASGLRPLLVSFYPRNTGVTGNVTITNSTAFNPTLGVVEITVGTESYSFGFDGQTSGSAIFLGFPLAITFVIPSVSAGVLSTSIHIFATAPSGGTPTIGVAGGTFSVVEM